MDLKQVRFFLACANGEFKLIKVGTRRSQSKSLLSMIRAPPPKAKTSPRSLLPPYLLSTPPPRPPLQSPTTLPPLQNLDTVPLLIPATTDPPPLRLSHSHSTSPAQQIVLRPKPSPFERSRSMEGGSWRSKKRRLGREPRSWRNRRRGRCGKRCSYWISRGLGNRGRRRAIAEKRERVTMIPTRTMR